MAFFSIGVALSAGLLASGCSREPSPSTSPSASVPAAPEPQEDAALVVSAPADAAPAMDAIVSVSLRGKDPVPVAGSDLSVFISQSSHKIRAPLAMVSILVARGAQKAQVGWRIESNEINGAWLPLEGRRYDSESESYVEEAIEGWLVRLDSVDDTSANASPTAITVSFKRAPR